MKLLYLHGWNSSLGGVKPTSLRSRGDDVIPFRTSLVVYPAASLVFEARRDARRIVVNPEIPGMVAGAGFKAVAKPATVGVPEVVAGLLAEAG